VWAVARSSAGRLRISAFPLPLPLPLPCAKAVVVMMLKHKASVKKILVFILENKIVKKDLLF
jgi:hypothetical protein